MIVYIEDVLIENLLITYLILHIVFVFSKNQKSKLKQVLASIVGALFSLLYPMLKINETMLLFLKFCVAYLITLVAFRTQKLKEQIFVYLMFVFVTAIYGGMALMISFSIYGNFSGEEKIPSVALIAVIFVITYLLNQCAKRIYKKKQINNFVYDVILQNNDNIIKTYGYLDSGNVLSDPQTKVPISLINSKLFFDINTNFDIADLIKKDIKKLKNGRYINVKTLTGVDKILVFDVDKLIIKKGKQKSVINNPSVALSKVNITELGCDVVLNANHCKGD